MRTVRDWIFTVPFLIAFGLALVFFDVVGRLVRPFSLRGFEWVMAALQRTLISTFRLCGTRIRVERSPEVKPRTAYAIISNHQSLLDIALIGGLLFSNYPKYVAKKELGKGIPSISLNLKHGGNAIIDRDDRRQAVRAIEEMAETAQDRGVSVVIFPEGTRSRNGELKPFRRAGAVTMLSAADQLPVVPVTVDGSWQLLINRMFPMPFGTEVKIRVGDPIERTNGDADDRLADAEKAIRTTLEEWRSRS